MQTGFQDDIVKLMDDYYVKIEGKYSGDQGNIIARMVLGIGNLEEWREEQLKDFSMAFIIRAKKARERPVRSEIISRDISA